MDRTLTIRLDESTARLLDAAAATTGASKGQLVREALRDRLQRQRPSALDALRRFVGVVDGPTDLSTNRRHLRGFGRRRRVP